MEDHNNDMLPAADCDCQANRDLAESRFQKARNFAAAKVNQIRKTATEQAVHLREFAKEKSDVICSKAKEFHKAGEVYVKEKPTQSVLIALGLGFVIGLLSRRR